jgi:hypothetical protein
VSELIGVALGQAHMTHLNRLRRALSKEARDDNLDLHALIILASPDGSTFCADWIGVGYYASTSTRRCPSSFY